MNLPTKNKQMEFNDEKLNQIATVAYSFRETVYHTYECAKEVIRRNVPGIFVECGVAAAGNLMSMQKAQKDTGLKIPIFGFDSFEGIPLAGEFDAEQPGIGKITHDNTTSIRDRLVSSGITVHSVNDVIYTLERFEMLENNIHLIKGWFQDTVPVNNIESISLLRLDGDLYESTLICMEYLYPKVTTGGIVIVDDFALPGCDKAMRDYFEEIGEQFPDMIEVPNSGGVVHFNKR